MGKKSTRPVAQRKHPKEYKAWENMKSRCYNSNATGYSDYGGRGIQVCDSWRTSFWSFYRDMGSAPTPKHSLDRINVDRDYKPGNCRWATRSEQARNTRLTKRHDGISLPDLAEDLGLSAKTLYQRVRAGRHPLDAQWQRTGLSEAARKSGIPVMTLKNRMVRNNISLDEAVKRGRKTLKK